MGDKVSARAHGARRRRARRARRRRSRTRSDAAARRRDGEAGRLSRCSSRPRPAAAARACASCSGPRGGRRGRRRARPREAVTAFGDGTVYLERFIESPRHVEIQVLADEHGNAVALGERECSVQRRHQKVVEETPSPIVDADLRAAHGGGGRRRGARRAATRSAGTVEFLVGADRRVLLPGDEHAHPGGAPDHGALLRRGPRPRADPRSPRACPSRSARRTPRSAATPSRRGSAPRTPTTASSPARARSARSSCPGGPGVRCDGHVYAGQEITLHYDNLLLKVIVHDEDRPRGDRAPRARALRDAPARPHHEHPASCSGCSTTSASSRGDYDTSLAEDLPAAGRRPRRHRPGRRRRARAPPPRAQGRDPGAAPAAGALALGAGRPRLDEPVTQRERNGRR